MSKSRTLTHSSREQIIRNAYNVCVKPALEQVDKKLKAFGDSIYQEVTKDFPPGWKVNIPRSFFNLESSIKVHFETLGYRALPLSDYQPAPPAYRHTVASYPQDHLFCSKFQVLTDERESVEKAWQETRESLSGVLNSVRTTKQLLSVWPEAEKYFPEGWANPATPNLPAVQIEKLNCKLQRLSGSDRDCDAIPDVPTGKQSEGSNG